MKNIIPAFILISAIIAISCNNKAESPSEKEEITDVDSLYSWQASLNDSTGRLQLIKTENTGPDSLEVNAVISFLNTANPNVLLEFIKTSNDTVYVKIPNAMYLTQQMGSTGPTIYFANAVYNLTEVPEFKFVNFEFEEGDHASPGTYNRDSFKDE